MGLDFKVDPPRLPTTHILAQDAHCPLLTVHSLISDPASPPGVSSSEPRRGH